MSTVSLEERSPCWEVSIGGLSYSGMLRSACCYLFTDIRDSLSVPYSRVKAEQRPQLHRGGAEISQNNNSSSSQKLSAFYNIRSSTKSYHLSTFWFKSSPHPPIQVTNLKIVSFVGASHKNSSLMRATCAKHIIFLDWIVTIYDEQYKSWSLLLLPPSQVHIFSFHLSLLEQWQFKFFS